MLDIKLLRSDFEAVEKALSTRNEEFDLSQFKDLDEKTTLLSSLDEYFNLLVACCLNIHNQGMEEHQLD